MPKILAFFAAVHALFAWAGAPGLTTVGAELGKAFTVAMTVGSFLLHAASFLAPYVGHGVAFLFAGLGTILTFVGSALTRELSGK